MCAGNPALATRHAEAHDEGASHFPMTQTVANAFVCSLWLGLLTGLHVWRSQGVYVAYVIVAWCYIGVSVAGYWAFGINVAGDREPHLAHAFQSAINAFVSSRDHVLGVAEWRWLMAGGHYWCGSLCHGLL